MDEKITNLLSTEGNGKGSRSDLIRKGEQWEAINTMSDLDDPRNFERRERLIRKRGKERFEHNLETLLLK
jgi:hypothetical protein